LNNFSVAAQRFGVFIKENPESKETHLFFYRKEIEGIQTLTSIYIILDEFPDTNSFRKYYSVLPGFQKEEMINQKK